MGTKVIVNTTTPNRVAINNQQRATIRTVAVASTNVNKLEFLTDVDASDPNNNETLVYDVASGKYIVKELPNINGGTF